MRAHTRIALFGQLAVVQTLPNAAAPRRIAHFRTEKTKALLGYLAYHRGRAHPREVLIGLLWPEQTLDSARNRLSVALSSLRGQLEGPEVGDGGVIVADRFSVRLNPDMVTTDVAEFEAALANASHASAVSEQIHRLTQAVDLYEGPLLPGFYEDWVLPEQARLADRFCEACLLLVTRLEAEGQLREALERARRAVSADPWREEAHRAVMRVCVALGEPAAALRQYRQLEQLLGKEGGRPSAETRDLAAAIAGGREGEGTNGREDVRTTPVRSSPPPAASTRPLVAFSPLTPHSREAPGGALPLDSALYLERPVDAAFRAAVERRDSIVLLKGPRHVGKSSLLARGLQAAREAGARVVLTDLQKLTATQLTAEEAVARAVAEGLAEQVELDGAAERAWNPARAWNANFERFVRREVLGSTTVPVVWGLDGVDRVFAAGLGADLFSLFRAWHNERALDPGCAWWRLTLAIAFATEPHLFITDLDHSPFNVGTRLDLEDFAPEQVAELNRRWGTPLPEAEVRELVGLVGGHPYLVQRALHEAGRSGGGVAALAERAKHDDGPFADHLRRVLGSLSLDPELRQALGEFLSQGTSPDAAAFYRLRSAGVLAGDTPGNARVRCELYRAYLTPRLG